MTIVDSCIVIDIVENGEFTDKAKAALVARTQHGKVYAPEIVFAEVCYVYEFVEHVNSIFHSLDIEVVPLGDRALFRAAKAFEKFDLRRKQAPHADPLAKRILADFYVGALAEEEGIPLLTRDTKRKWNLDFPTLQIIQP